MTKGSTSDDQAKGILIHELKVLYEAFSNEKPSPLPDLPIQYVDFSHWQRQWLQKGSLKTQLAYWQEKLGPNIPLLQLPTDYQRPVLETFRCALQQFITPASLSDAIRTFSKRVRVTLFITLLAVFQTLLYCYSKQEDFLVFSSTTGRSRPEFKKLIGLFANILALRANFSGDPTFMEILDRVRKIVFDAYSNQDVPFDQLVNTIQQRKGLSHAPCRSDKLTRFCSYKLTHSSSTRK